MPKPNERKGGGATATAGNSTRRLRQAASGVRRDPVTARGPAVAPGPEKLLVPRRCALAKLLTPDEMRQKLLLVLERYKTRVFGYDEEGLALLICLLIPGYTRHAYAVGLPGLAKTLSMETISQLIDGLVFRRIQCNDDLSASDLSGSSAFNPETRKMELLLGELVGVHLALADEINRAPPQTQSGILQAMAEGRVSIAREKKPILMEDPFVVFSNSNPAEEKGVYPLTSAFLDRNLFQLCFGYVDEVSARKMHRSRKLIYGASGVEKLEPAMNRDELIQARLHIAENVHVADPWLDYMYEVVDATRPGQKYFERMISKHPDTANVLKYIRFGAGPRAEECLIIAAKSMPSSSVRTTKATLATTISPRLISMLWSRRFCGPASCLRTKQRSPTFRTSR